MVTVGFDIYANQNKINLLSMNVTTIKKKK